MVLRVFLFLKVCHDTTMSFLVMKKHRYQLLALLVLLLALLLRLPGLADDGLIPDEPFYAIRSISLQDDFGSEVQNTPAQWINRSYNWTKFSFFDHPPLTFWINHAFIIARSDALEGSRTASALASAFATLFIIGIGSRLYSRKTGLIAGALWATSVFVVGFARSSMMESIAIFFILLSVYSFLRMRENPRWLYLWGAALGFAILSKYTALVAVPVYIYFLIKRKQKNLGGPLLLLFLILTPVFYYNLMLLQTVGHFDLQFSKLFHLQTPGWNDVTPELQKGSVLDRIVEMTDFAHLVTPLMLLMIIMAIPLFYRKKKTIVSVLLIFFWVSLLFFGAKDRFMFYSMPFFVLMIAATVDRYIKGKTYILLAVILFYQTAVSVNTHLLYPAGKAVLIEHITYPKRSIRWETDVPKIAAEMDVLVREDMSGDIVLDSKMPIEASLWIGLRHKISGEENVFWDKVEDFSGWRYQCVLYDNKARKYSFFTGDPAHDGVCQK